MKRSASFEAFYADWRQARYKAERNSLKPGQNLQPAGISYLADAYTEPVSRQAREPLLAAQGDGRPSLNDTAGPGLSLQLRRPLKTGSGRWSQVWLAHVEGPCSASPELIVVKLFQESRFSDPSRWEEDDLSMWKARGHAAREAWAFRVLQDFQGSLLPISYGFFDFILPCSETVCGHVMEYIDGVKLQRDYAKMRDGTWHIEENVNQRRTWVSNLYSAISAFHAYGVHHGDLSPRNILQLRENPDRFVVIDFGRASPPDAVPIGVLDDDDGLRESLEEIHECPSVFAFLEGKCAAGDPLMEAWKRPNLLKALERRAKRTEAIHEARAARDAQVDSLGDGEISGSS